MDEAINTRLGELLIGLKNGQKDALEGIHSLFCSTLYTIANTYYRYKVDVEDAVQDFYATLPQKVQNFRQIKFASAWLFKVFRNQILSDLRSKQRQNDHVNVESIRNLAAPSDAYGSDVYIQNHLFLQEIFSSLTNSEQELIIYSYLCHYSLSQVASLVHKPKSTVQYRLERIKEKINKEHSDK